MSSRLLGMFELSSPLSRFYALDMNVPHQEVESFLKDGLRNFKSFGIPREVCIKTALSGKAEIGLPFFAGIDASNDELILDRMKECLAIISRKTGTYSNAFLIIQEWVPENNCLFSLNLIQLKKRVIAEAVKGSPLRLKKGEGITTLRLGSNIQVLKSGMGPADISHLTKLLRSLINRFVFKEGFIYELSFTSSGVVFHGLRNSRIRPTTKEEFYSILAEKGINYNGKILRR